MSCSERTCKSWLSVSCIYVSWASLNLSSLSESRPRDGRNIGLFQLIGALRKVYNVSIPLAVILAVGGFIKCSHSFFSLHLSDLNTHGKIEHNASLAHLDVHEGDPTIVNRPLLQQLLADSSDGVGLTVEDFVKARVRREAPLQVNTFFNTWQ
jgi:hypothetical protein